MNQARLAKVEEYRKDMYRIYNATATSDNPMEIIRELCNVLDAILISIERREFE
jgi:hypothetical protein